MEPERHHILYIEDHDDTRELVTLVLSERNYRVTTGTTIVSALKLSREHHFDLYMLDSWLPDGSGIELCKRLREFDHETPIMFLSGAAYEADRQAALASGAQRYMVKPADIQELCFEVDALIFGFANQMVAAVEAMPTRSHEVVSIDAPTIKTTVINPKSSRPKRFLAQ